MKKVIFAAFLFMAVCDLNLHALAISPDSYQVVKPQDDIKALFEAEEYNTIIELYAGQPRMLSAEELVYVAKAYYNLGDAQNGLIYADLARKKDAQNGEAYYLKGVITSDLDNNDEAITYFMKALEINRFKGKYYAGLADVYMKQEEFDKAFSYYNKALKQANPGEETYFMVASAYASVNDMPKSLDAFYTAKSHIVKDKELYATVLYHIGLMEFEDKNYEKAIAAYKELIEYFPHDYHSKTQLIQSYNALGKYKEADVYKKILYKAFENRELAGTELREMFPIDQFNIGDKMISTYEYFEKEILPCDTSGVKTFIPVYQFYILNADNQIESNLEFGHSSEDASLPGNKQIEYVLQENNDGLPPKILSKSTSKEYPVIKEAVIKNMQE